MVIFSENASWRGRQQAFWTAGFYMESTKDPLFFWSLKLWASMLPSLLVSLGGWLPGPGSLGAHLHDSKEVD